MARPRLTIPIYFYGGPANGLSTDVAVPAPVSITYLGAFYVRREAGSQAYYYQRPLKRDAHDAWRRLTRTLAHTVPRSLRQSARARRRIKRLLR